MYEGEPVDRFGLSVVPDVWNLSDDFIEVTENAIAVTDNGGRFSTFLPSGRWALVFSGDDFARTIVRGIIVERGRMNHDLLINAERGRRITGIVRDASGAPLEGAEVSVIQSSRRDNHLTNRANGNYITETEKDGRFSITGYRQRFGGETQVRATIQGMEDSVALSSHAIPLGRNVSDVVLTVFPSGSLTGTVVVPSPKETLMVVRPLQMRAAPQTTRVHSNGTFVFSDIPEGEYSIGIWEFENRPRFRMTRRVTIVAGKVTSVSLP